MATRVDGAGDSIDGITGWKLGGTAPYVGEETIKNEKQILKH